MKDIFSICYSAIQNERSVQSYLYTMRSLDSDLYGSAPGLSNILEPDFRFAAFIMVCIRFSFPAFLVFFNFYFLVVYSLKKIFLRNKLPAALITNNILFASSGSAISLTKKAISDNCIVILRPGRASKSILHDDQFFLVDSLVFVSYRDLFKIFFKVLIVSFLLFFKRDSSKYFFLLAYLFEFLIVKESFEGVSSLDHPKSLYITDHFDRWAVLFDHLKALSYFNSFSVIQHGILTINSVDDFKINLYYKLNNVDFLYYFDNASLEVFKAKVISVDCIPVFIRFSNCVSLVDFDVKVFSILFVGSPICYKFQLGLMRKINEDFPLFSLFYKPHPTDLISHQGLQDSFNSLTVVDGDVFPKVNIVVSYPSSLAYQYSELGIPVVFHELDSGIDAVNECLNKIKLHYEMSI